MILPLDRGIGKPAHEPPPRRSHVDPNPSRADTGPAIRHVDVHGRASVPEREPVPRPARRRGGRGAERGPGASLVAADRSGTGYATGCSPPVGCTGTAGRSAWSCGRRMARWRARRASPPSTTGWIRSAAPASRHSFRTKCRRPGRGCATFSGARRSCRVARLPPGNNPPHTARMARNHIPRTRHVTTYRWHGAQPKRDRDHDKGTDGRLGA